VLHPGLRSGLGFSSGGRVGTLPAALNQPKYHTR